MESNVGGRDRLLRGVLAVLLTIVAVVALRKGKRKTGLLAGVGALGFGFNAVTQYCGLNDTLDIDTTASESVETAGAGTSTGQAASTAETATVTAGGSTATESASGGSSLTCADCGQPIRVGQRRGPNENDEIVHDECPA